MRLFHLVCLWLFVSSLANAHVRVYICESQVSEPPKGTVVRSAPLPGRSDFKLLFDWESLASDTPQAIRAETESALVDALIAMGPSNKGLWNALPNQVLVTVAPQRQSWVSPIDGTLTLRPLSTLRLTVAVFLHEFGHLVLHSNLRDVPKHSKAFKGMDEFYGDLFSWVGTQDPQAIFDLAQELTAAEGMSSFLRPDEQTKLAAFNLAIDLTRHFNPPVTMSIDDFMAKLLDLDKTQYDLKQQQIVQSDFDRIWRGHPFMGWLRQECGQNPEIACPSRQSLVRVLRTIRAAIQTEGVLEKHSQAYDLKDFDMKMIRSNNLFLGRALR